MVSVTWPQAPLYHLTSRRCINFILKISILFARAFGSNFDRAMWTFFFFLNVSSYSFSSFIEDIQAVG